ncbi:PulJ/GspJ family protein [Paludisphaera rhizosphaerae]|uniref:PulJ/GspJ family protein n=1 Tax=Paludisphaera rhizosphaerae TaxID=2711216 RepID=UPI0013EA0FB9|nr:hypothetical protein [Paludisphaera rhizosphaerae]
MSTLTFYRSAGSRRGVSLVELMVTMAAVAAMLGISVMLLGLTMRLETDGRSAFERTETIARLSGRFRNDVHQSREAALDGRVLRLGRVEYRVDDHGELTRAVVVEGKDTAHEAYRIPGSAGARLALREINGRRFAVLSVDVQPRQDRVDPIRPVEVEALVGKTAASARKAEGGRP